MNNSSLNGGVVKKQPEKFLMKNKVLFIESCWTCPYIGHAYLLKTGCYCNHPKSTMKYNLSSIEKGVMTDEDAKNGFWDGCPLGSI